MGNVYLIMLSLNEAKEAESRTCPHTIRIQTQTIINELNEKKLHYLQNQNSDLLLSSNNSICIVSRDIG